MKYKKLNRAENIIRRMVEEPFSWFAGGALDPFQLARHLVIHYIVPAAKTKRPNRFVIHINPRDLSNLGDEVTAFESQVVDYVGLLTERYDSVPADPVLISVEADQEIEQQKAEITASLVEKQASGDTEVFSNQFANDFVLEALKAVDAFLIIQGRRHIPLDRPITRIGRRMDNDLILDTPSISRYHAQIRWRQRFFVLYDASGHGRTIVNGMVTKEHILRPGDVIALSEVLLVYGEGRDENFASELWPEDEEAASTLLRPEE
jgi:hypothetical protein